MNWSKPRESITAFISFRKALLRVSIPRLESRARQVLDQAGSWAAQRWRDTRAPMDLPRLHRSFVLSCAVWAWRNDDLVAQPKYLDVHRAVAELISLPPDKVRCIHVQGSGCYGQNGADDVSADAALVAIAMPDTPIRMQWMREQEFGWEPLGPAMVTELEGSIGKIVAWKHEVWSNPHNNRPIDAGGISPGRK